MTKKKKPEFERVVDFETGEFKDYAKIEMDEDTLITIESKEEKRKKAEEVLKQQYRMRARRIEQFAQAMPRYENDVIGTYPARMLECLIRTLPFINYNSGKFNEQNIIKNQGKAATVSALANLWKVTRPTATKYIKRFIKDGIWSPVKLSKVNGSVFQFKNDVFLKGKKGNKEFFSKKVVLKSLGDMIRTADQEVDRILNKPYTREERLYKEQLSSFHPLALFGALLTKTHFKSFFLVNNSTDEIISDEETVSEVIGSSHKRRRFRFMKKYEMWNLYEGKKTKSLSGDRKLELEACLYVLTRIKALGTWKTGKSEYIIMNPSLVYVSPNMKCDDEWRKVIGSLFCLPNIMEKESDPDNLEQEREFKELIEFLSDRHEGDGEHSCEMDHLS
ncbi:hypothetical protein [Cohnella panacarvi]|uniref:hypothetical protein n=1 Tax=Cohnella panacarvi TaxID=400776 RepID=UPI00047A46B7|nr:hypothetical protein [Cohnella panacarvi]